MTTFVDTDVHIHKDDSLTQRNNAAGVAVDVDVDGIAGVHKITIQTADNTVADFYEAGHDYADGWPGVKKAVDEIFGKPDKVYMDSTWVKGL